MKVEYTSEKRISAEQFVALLKETSLGARRPLDDAIRIRGMLDKASLLVTAWQEGRLVGVARSVTDFHYCCYLSDLAVSETIQASGVGRGLISHTFAALHDGCSIMLIAAPQAVDYYPKIGFTRHDSAWVMADASKLK